METLFIQIEDLYERINNVYNTVMNDEDKMSQLAYYTGFLIALKGRLDRVCER
jgi:hypothetical protein